MKIKNTWILILGILSIIILAFYGLSPLHSYDLGYHLATGKYILSTHTIPQKDPFSFTNPTGIWPNHQWLPATLIYICYKYFGYRGLIAFKVIFLFSLATILYLTCKRIQKNSWLCILFVTGSLFLARVRFLVRPLLFSFVLFSLFVFFTVRIRQDQKKRDLWFLMGTVFLWCHSHAAVVFSSIFIGFWALGDWLEKNSPEVRIKVVQYYSVGLLLGGSSVAILNPGGFWGLLEPIFFWKDEYFRKHVMEFLPPDFYHQPLFFVILGLTFLGFLFERTQRPVECRSWQWSWILPWIVFSILSLRIQRMIVYMAILTPLVWLGLLARKSKVPFFQDFKGVFVSSYTVLLVLYLVTVPWNLTAMAKARGIQRMVAPPARSNWFPELDAQVLPVGALAFVQKVGIQGRVFNEDSWGGWLSHFFYPHSQVFIDNRLPVYGASFFQSVYFPILQGDRSFGTYQINWAILRTEIGGSGLQSQLIQDPGWQLFFLDHMAMVFVRSQHVKTLALEEHRLPALNKWLRDFHQKITPQMGEEILRDLDKINRFWTSSVVLNLMGVIESRQKKWDLGKQYFEEALLLDSCYKQALENLSKIYQIQGDIVQMKKIQRRNRRCPEESIR